MSSFDDTYDYVVVGSGGGVGGSRGGPGGIRDESMEVGIAGAGKGGDGGTIGDTRLRLTTGTRKHQKFHRYPKLYQCGVALAQ